MDFFTDAQDKPIVVQMMSRRKCLEIIYFVQAEALSKKFAQRFLIKILHITLKDIFGKTSKKKWNSDFCPISYFTRASTQKSDLRSPGWGRILCCWCHRVNFLNL